MVLLKRAEAESLAVPLLHATSFDIKDHQSEPNPGGKGNEIPMAGHDGRSEPGRNTTSSGRGDQLQCLNLASDGRGEIESRTYRQGKRLMNSGTETITVRDPRTEISMKEEYSISKDGKKLSIKTTRTTPHGVIMLKQVFLPPSQIWDIWRCHHILRFGQWQLGYRRYGASDGVQSRDR